MSRVDDQTVQRLQQSLAAEGVHTLIAQFTDIHGVAKGKLVPLAHSGHGAAYRCGVFRPVDRRHRPAAHGATLGVLRAR